MIGGPLAERGQLAKPEYHAKGDTSLMGVFCSVLANGANFTEYKEGKLFTSINLTCPYN